MANLIKRLLWGFMAAGLSACLALDRDSAQEISNPNRSSYAHQPAASLSVADSEPVRSHQFKSADFGQEHASQEARRLANWVVNSGDNHSLSFVIIDKKDAKAFVFNADGRLRGAAPALLGLSKGDDSIPGIGNRKLSSMRPDERTTPAGRFVAALDHNLRGEEILWVDYDTAISLHQVHTTNLRERRAERLSTPTPLDNRISFGCINVPVDFHKNVVVPAFTRTQGIVYVLPEVRSLREVFSSYGFVENNE